MENTLTCGRDTDSLPVEVHRSASRGNFPTARSFLTTLYYSSTSSISTIKVTCILYDMSCWRKKMSNTAALALALFPCIAAGIIAAVHGCPPSDRAALESFKASMSEPYLGIFTSWAGNDCCHGWYGVFCDPLTGRVAELNLRGESEDPILTRSGRTGYMTGSLPPNLCNLRKLTSFILADWKEIFGSIPPCIASLTSLRILDLSGNRISGRIPSNFGNLQRLAVVNLADNEISGAIPATIAEISDLRHLDLRKNRLCGIIPPEFGKLGMLSRALLSQNELSGSIPDSIATMRRLVDLDLSMNRLSGPIPAKLGTIPVLSTLNLDGNRISGQVPVSLIRSGINVLNLSRNSMEGPIPDSFGSESYFTVLDLSGNNLKGRVPGSMSKARYIGHLDLSNNHLCGLIPQGPPFDHLEATSFSGNDCLCGLPLKTTC